MTYCLVINSSCKLNKGAHKLKKEMKISNLDTTEQGKIVVTVRCIKRKLKINLMREFMVDVSQAT